MNSENKNTSTNSIGSPQASSVRVCQSCKQNFVIEPEDFDFYRKLKVPPPTFCPLCREQRRIAIRNERVLYRDNCDLCKKPMVSSYSSDKPFTVYCHDCWNGDDWDPLDYGRDYDWNKPFFKQWQELLAVVPRINLSQLRGSVNSEYANFTLDVKNVYLTFSCLYSENIYYGRTIDESKESFDCFNIKNSEMVYENVDCARNYRSHFMLRSRDCIDSSFLFDSANCQNCFMSSNLRNGNYIFRNEQLNKETFKKELEKIDFGSISEVKKLKEEWLSMVSRSLHKFANVNKVLNCSGDNIENSKNVHFGFDVYNSENIKFGTRVIGGKDVYDVYGSKAESSYEGVASGLDSFNNRFMLFADSMKDSDYFEWCQYSSNLFGCTGIKKVNYCILNKKYSKEEYEELLPKIIEQMNGVPYIDKRGRVYRYGEMFPIEVGCFAYNETLAQEHHPLTKEEALKEGYDWRDPDPYPHKSTKTPKDLPDNIKDVEDTILNDVIGCSSCDRSYRIIQQELTFLRQNKIALPIKCPDCRYKDRFKLRNPLKLWHRKCMCDYKIYKNSAKHSHHLEGNCPNEFEASYSPDRKEIVYCEQCYNAEVV